MFTLSRTLIKAIIWLAAGMVCIVVLHLGGVFALHVGQFAPVVGAYIGGILAFSSACLRRKNYEKTEPWIGFEQLSWLLIGLGTISITCRRGLYRLSPICLCGSFTFATSRCAHKAPRLAHG